MSAGADLEQPLRAWLGERVGDARLEIAALVRRSEGFSWETYLMEAAWRDPATGATRREGFAVRVNRRTGCSRRTTSPASTGCTPP